MTGELDVSLRAAVLGWATAVVLEVDGADARDGVVRLDVDGVLGVDPSLGDTL